MNKKKAISALILFTLCFAVVAQVSAQTETTTIGVSEGNVFRYEYKIYWNSTNSNDTVPINSIEQNTTEWLQATIKTVTGNTATIAWVQHFQNGTEKVLNQEITSVGTVNQLSILLYVANLNQGSLLLPTSQFPDYWVNSTVSRSYPGGARETNYILYSQANIDKDGDGNIDDLYKYSSRYFDKQTGVLVEANESSVSSAYPSQIFASSYELMYSNVWTVGGSSSGGGNDGGGSSPVSWLTSEMVIVIVIVVVMVALIAGLLLIRRRRSKKRRR